MQGKNKIILLLLATLVSLEAMPQAGQSQVDSLAARVMRGLRANKQETVFIRSDRSFYAAGEKIWFRSFLTNVYTGKLSSQSDILFVDLVNDKDSVIEKILIPSGQFKTDGYLSVHDSVSTGFYWIRAYTQLMALQSPERIGVQAVYIVNTARPAIARENRVMPKATDTSLTRIEFFPEGGAVVGGANTTIGFRSTDGSGAPKMVSGLVRDDHDSIVSRFQSNQYGLGKFTFFNWSWRNYHAVTAGSPAKIFPLPRVNSFASQLAVINDKGSRKLRVVLEDSIYKRDKSTYIIGVSGDSLCLAAIGKGSYEVMIPEYKFPHGVADFFLFDEEQRLLSERSVFMPGNKPGLVITTDKDSYGPRQPVQLSVTVSDAEKRSFVSSMYVTVVDSVIVEKTKPITDVTQRAAELAVLDRWALMDTTLREEDIDALLLTRQKNNRTDHHPEFDAYPPADSSFYLKGRVQDKNGKPLANRNITVYSGNRNLLVLTDTTGPMGEFSFPLVGYYDQTKFNLQVTDQRQLPEEVKIKLDTLLRFPQFVTPAFLKKRFSVEGVKEFLTEQRKRSVQDTVMMGKGWLKEVIVRSTIKKEEYNRDKRVSSFSRILTSKQLQNSGSDNVANSLYRIPGVTIRNGFLVLRNGPNQLRNPSAADEPLLIMDGVAILPDAVPDNMNVRSPLLHFFNSLDARIIDFIEVVTGAQAAFFGTRGAGGAILIHTKKSQTEIGNSVNGLTTITMPGYQQPLAFDSPDYSIRENRNNRFPDRRNVLYWNGDLVTDEQGKLSLLFYTADPSTKYYVTITGITAGGKLVTRQATISRR